MKRSVLCVGKSEKMLKVYNVSIVHAHEVTRLIMLRHGWCLRNHFGGVQDTHHVQYLGIICSCCFLCKCNHFGSGFEFSSSICSA
jgi:hypothetical protein